MITVRPARDGDVDTLIDVFLHAMGRPANEGHGRLLRGLTPTDRILAGIDEHGVLAATALSIPTRLAVPVRRSVPAAVVSGVGVLPTYRRRGFLTALMTAQLRALRDEGTVAAALRATEGPIYGRFGYGPAAPEVRVRISRRRAALATAQELPGRLRLVATDEVSEVVPAAHGALWVTSPGEIERSPDWWKLAGELFADLGKSSRITFVVHEGTDGAIDGYAGYAISSDERGAAVEVIGLYATDDDVRTALLHHCLSIDLVREVRLRTRIDDPLPWRLHDPRAFQLTSHNEGPWLRLLDVPRALEGRSYSDDGRLVIEVDDAQLPENRGRWALTVEAGDATCAATDAPADLALDAATLASAYLGGTRLATLARAGRVQVASAGAVAVADRLFATDPLPLSQTDL